ncbi:Gfo/Idh/MocA family protein [Segnochrobactrum spirostomi]|uniref:Gfo/Idh/MocA family oxidoreductase n=1 Tax=Segnochrobactrum spirostomi TaxID=2608987 RepID=A0A6A7Y7U5_9HYPH|nr:Gfo/Idh/MocA family oxidoreductase [Segnochrobactrum spirostomi]MQT14926.1 Gfo/Idh/MocA family oxidoreductase [Segnochrobactrum spirostomi]
MLRLGLIGLGEVAQLIHLPILQRLGDLYSLAGAYDPSPSVAAAVCPRWGIARTFATAEDLIASPDIDAVLVLSPDQYHGAHARAALQAGKHVLIEKPCCLEKDDLAALSAVAEASDRVAMVGYMRRFAPAFVEAKARLPELDAITYVRVRDVICEGPWFFQQVDQVAVPPGDIPTALLDESRSLRAGMVDKVIGADAPADLRTAYSVLTGLSSHSLSAMRDLIGSPKRVIAAEVKQGGAQITALFDYGTFTALYECMIGDVVRFEAGFEINTRTERLAWEYPTPYVRNLPMVLDVQHSTAHDNSLTRLGPFYQDPFDAELRAFHAAATEGAENRTPPAESAADLDLFAAIIAAARRTAD